MKLPDEACMAPGLARALTNAGFPLASVPPDVVHAALKMMPGAQSITPATVRQHFARQQLPGQTIEVSFFCSQPA